MWTIPTYRIDIDHVIYSWISLFLHKEEEWRWWQRGRRTNWVRRESNIFEFIASFFGLWYMQQTNFVATHVLHPHSIHEYPFDHIYHGKSLFAASHMKKVTSISISNWWNRCFNFSNNSINSMHTLYILSWIKNSISCSITVLIK